MEVRLLSVGARSFFLAASRLAFAAKLCRPQREKNLWQPGLACKLPCAQFEHDYIRFPRYFDLTTSSFGYALHSFPIGYYFELFFVCSRLRVRKSML